MNIRFLLLILFFVCYNPPLQAGMDEDEWTAEKHKLIGKGLMVIGAVGILYSLVNGLQAEPFTTIDNPVNNFIGVSFLTETYGVYHWLRGVTGLGLENPYEDNTTQAQQRIELLKEHAE